MPKTSRKRVISDQELFELLNVYPGTLHKALYELGVGQKVFPSDVWGKNCVFSGHNTL